VKLLRVATCFAVVTLGCDRSLAADWGPLNGPYDEPDSHGVDVMASGLALLPMLAVAGACGLVVLPADVVYEARNPDEEFGKAGEKVCTPPAAGVGLGVYMVAGLPLYAGKKVFWDLPRSAFDDEAAESPEPAAEPVTANAAD
jgi:hypothetical protein